jgi:hypothetical protein
MMSVVAACLADGNVCMLVIAIMLYLTMLRLCCFNVLWLQALRWT